MAMASQGQQVQKRSASETSEISETCSRKNYCQHARATSYRKLSKIWLKENTRGMKKRKIMMLKTNVTVVRDKNLTKNILNNRN